MASAEPQYPAVSTFPAGAIKFPIFGESNNANVW